MTRVVPVVVVPVVVVPAVDAGGARDGDARRDGAHADRKIARRLALAWISLPTSRRRLRVPDAGVIAPPLPR